MQFTSKLPASELTIFSVMSSLAKKHDAINLGQGFPDFDCDQKLKDLVAKYLNAGKNQYCPMPGSMELRMSITKKAELLYGNQFDPAEEVCVCAGATQAIFTAITAFIHSGDEVILFEPAYDSYTPSIQIAGGVPISYKMTYPDYRIDWDRVGAMITEKTKMIIINTPHNPTGTVLSQSDLEALESLLAEKNIIVLSDEVYEHLVYDNTTHESVLKYPKLYRQSLAVFSFGKTFHSTGWKMGYIMGPRNLMEEFKKVHQWNVFSVNSFTQFALAEYLNEPSHYLNLPSFYAKKRDLLIEALNDSRLHGTPSRGTFFQLFNYGEISDMSDIEFAKFMTVEKGVAAIPLSPFYAQATGDKVIRLCFAKKEDTLLKAAERLRNL